jgi:hypothetical protein
VRKPAAILFLLLLTFTVLGHQVVFYALSREAKAEMKAYLQTASAGPAETIRFTPDEVPRIDWQEDGKEFSWKGQLYDVISKTEGRDGLRIRCISDTKETGLLHAFLDGIRKQRGKNNSLGKLLSVQFLEPATTESVAPCGQPPAVFGSGLHPVQTRSLAILVPPPRQGTVLFS